MKNIPLINRKDFILIALMLFIAGAMALAGNFSHSGQTATVTCDGETVTVIQLENAENGTFTVNNTVIEIKDGKIGFSDSNCDDRICVRTGMLDKHGEASACIPNKVAISISDTEKDHIDIMAY